MTSLLKTLFMGLDDFPIQIGVNYQLRAEHADGTIHAQTPSGQVCHVNFVADKPRRLRHPSVEQIQSLFDQAKRLGLNPRQIETRVGNRHRVYTETASSPILDHQTV